MTEKVFLVVRADRSMRLTRRYPHLRLDEIAVRLNIVFPPEWGQVMDRPVDITVPEPPQPLELTPGEADGN